MTRRMQGLLVLLAALALLAAACGSDDDSSQTAQATATPADTDDVPAAPEGESGDEAVAFAPGVLASGATIERFERGNLTVHTYTNNEAGFGNTTIIFELTSSLVLVDAHFAEGPAAEFRSFAESLDKPIDRIFVTHAHPDHIGGLDGVFAEIDAYSSAGVIAEAADAGTSIEQTISDGEVTIDGTTFLLQTFNDAEAPEQIVITVPDAGVMAIGDLVYSGYHFVMEPNFDNWLAILDELSGTDGLDLVIPGHGAPGDADSLIAEATDYLSTARDTWQSSPDAETFNSAMIDAYPDRLGRNLLSFGSDRLFPS